MDKRTALFFLVVLFLCSWHLDTGTNDNVMSRAAAVASLVDRGTLEITPLHGVTKDKAVVDGRYFSDKAPLPVLLVWPLHALLKMAGLADDTDRGSLGPALLRLGGLICGSMALAWIITCLYRDLIQRGTRYRLPLTWMAALPMLGSFLFVYSGSFNAHILGALFMLLAWLAHEKGRWMACGLWGAAAVLCEYPLVIFPVWWALELGWTAWRRRQGWKALGQLVSGGLPGVLVLMAVNHHITGDPFTLAYAHEAHYTFMDKGFGMGLPSLKAIHGLTLSNYRGLLVYMPAIAVMLVAMPIARRQGRAVIPRAALVPLVLCFLVIASYGMWWGGWAYGPRHLTAVATLLLLFGLRALDVRPWLQWLLLAASGIGLALALAAKSTVWYSLPSEVYRPFREVIMPHMAQGRWTALQWPVDLGLSPGAATLAYLMIFAAALYLLARIDQRPAPHAPVP